MTHPTLPDAAPLDLQKYGRPELAEHIHGVLAVQGDLRRTAAVMMAGIAGVWIAATLVFYDSGWLVWAGVAVCCSFAAFELLASASMWWTLRSKLMHAVAATEIVVDICIDVVRDIDDIAAGSVASPTPAQLVHSVFNTVVHPIVAAQAAGSVAGKVLGWLYTRHTAAVERSVIERIPAAHEPLPTHAVGEQRHRIDAVAEILSQVRERGVQGLRHFNRHVLPAFALAAIAGTMLQVIPLAITTALLAADTRAPRVTGVLTGDTPLLDPATGAAACAVLLQARYDEPSSQKRDDGTQAMHSRVDTSFHVAQGAMLTVNSSGEALQLTGKVDQPWASNQLFAVNDVPQGTLPTYLPAALRNQPNLTLRTDTIACGETHTLYGTHTDGNITLEPAPPQPAVRVLAGLFLLYLFHQVGGIPVLLAMAYAAAHVAYLVFAPMRNHVTNPEAKNSL